MKPLKGKISQTTTCRKEYKIVTNPHIFEPYWDEGINFKGRLMHYQCRMYRTWKHSRKTQYKE